MRFASVLLSVAAILAVAAEWLSARPTATQELTGLLHEFMDAAGRGDRAVFDKFFADDVIYTRASGVVITKADIMASLEKGAASAEPKEKVTYLAEDLTVHEYGEMAVVAFRLVGRTEQTDGKVVTAHYRNTGTFLRRNGRWQAVAWQATKISDSGRPSQ
jgi:ketosteroid isomerase-like protein